MIHSVPVLLKSLFKSGYWLAHTNSTFLGQGQSTVTQQAEMTVAKFSQMSCM